MTLAAQEAQQQRQQQAGAASPPAAPAALQQGQPHTAPHQTCDYTTLLAAAHDLRSTLCPSKVEQALQVRVAAWQAPACVVEHALAD